MKVGFFQFNPEFGNVERNLNKVVSTLNHSLVDLVVLPELPFTGYFFENRDELISLAEDPQQSEIVTELSTICRQRNMYIVTGFAEKSGDKYFNSSLLLGPEGIVHTYRKLHLFNREHECFDPGDTPLAVHDVKGVKVGMMICFDWIFPEVSRILAIKGAEIICHPSNLVLDYCQTAMTTRCLENHVFAITTNRYGSDNRPHGDVKFTGKSQITDPKGAVVYQATSMLDSLYITNINIEDARDKQITEHNHVLTDRRPEMYGDLCVSE